MPNPTPQAHLHPQFCFHPTALSTFLRTSRSLTDDTLNTSLNTLLTPSTTSPLTPATTTTRTGPTPHTLPLPTCTAYLITLLFPSWDARSHALEYCRAVALSPDPDDPEAVEREVYNARGRMRVVDERLDPYSGRWREREGRTAELLRRVEGEEGVERVVRGRSWGVLGGRCVGFDEGVEGWERGFERWRRGEGRRKKK